MPLAKISLLPTIAQSVQFKLFIILHLISLSLISCHYFSSHSFSALNPFNTDYYDTHLIMIQSSLICSVLFVHYFFWFALFRSHSGNVFSVTGCSEHDEIGPVLSHTQRDSHFSLISLYSLKVILISFIPIPHNT